MAVTPASWVWVLADAGGNALCELTTAAGRQIAYKRNNYAEATFSLGHADDAAALLLNAAANTGMPTLRCYRKGPNDSAGVLKFHGYCAPFSESLDENTGALSLVFRSPFARLCSDGVGSGRFTDASISCVQQDAGQIAASLVSQYGGSGDNGGAFGFAPNTFDKSFAGLLNGTITATVLRDRTYQFSPVGEAIIALSQVLDGFDFDETFSEPVLWPVASGVGPSVALAKFNVYASQGIDNPGARFEYGPTTLNSVRAVERTTAPPINTVRMIGANNLFSYYEDTTSVGQYGRWWTQQQQPDIIEQATLDARARALIRSKPVKTLTFTPDLGLDSCPKPWDDFWLGDTVRFYGRKDAFSENLSVRVNEITVSIDENGNEATEIPDPHTLSAEDRENRTDLLHTSITVEQV